MARKSNPFEAAEVEKYQREVVQSVTAKDKKLKEELNQDQMQCPAGRLYSFRYLLDRYLHVPRYRVVDTTGRAKMILLRG